MELVVTTGAVIWAGAVEGVTAPMTKGERPVMTAVAMPVATVSPMDDAHVETAHRSCRSKSSWSNYRIPEK
jgi:hypothetical protein